MYVRATESIESVVAYQTRPRAGVDVERGLNEPPFLLIH